MKKGLLKRLSAVALSVGMAVSLVPVMGTVADGVDGQVEAKAAELSSSGTCGDNVTWTTKWDDEGWTTITISGNGPMENFEYNTPYGPDDSIKRVVIDNGVTSIGDISFSGCKSIESVSVSDTVARIGAYSFCNCLSLESITIPDSVIEIDEGAFSSSGLTSVEIPRSVINIGVEALAGCDDLICIKVSGYNSVFDSRSDCNAVIKTDTNELIAGCKRTIIPDGITSIGKKAFFRCTNLTSITMPDSIRNIDEYAFSGCSNLTSIIPSDNINTIGKGAFSGCRSIENINLPRNLSKIDESLFEDCFKLTEILIPDKVESIEAYAFYRCRALTSIEIPNTVTNIGNYAFAGCDSLTDIYYDGSEQEWKKITIGISNETLTNATIHYNSSGSGEGGETPTDSKVVNFTPLVTNIERNYNGNFYLPVAVTYKDGSSIEDGKTVRYFCSGVKKADVKTKNGVALIPLDSQNGTYEVSFSIIDGNKDYEYENDSASITVGNKEFSYKETLDMSAKLSFSGTLKKVFGIGVNLKNGMSIEVEEDDGSETVTLKNTGKLSAKASGTLSGKIKKFKAAAEASGSMDGTNTQTMKIKDFGGQNQKAQKAAIGYFLLRSIQNHGDLGIVSVTELDNLYREMYGNYSAFMLTDSEEASVSKEVEKGKLSVGKLGDSQYSLSANGGKTKYTTSVKEDSGKTTYSSGIEKYTGGLKLSGNWIFGLAGGTIYSSEQGVSKTKISASLADGNKEVTGTITSGTTDEISGTKVESETGATLKFTGENADKLIQNNEKIKKLINGGMPLYTDNDISSIYSSMYGSDLEGTYTLNKKYIEGINLSSSYGIDDSGNSSVGLEVSGTQSYALDAGYGVIYHGYTYPTVDSNYSSYAKMISWDLGYSAPELIGLGMEGLTAFLSDAMLYKMGKAIDGVKNKAAQVWSDIKNGWYVSVTSIGNTGSNVKLSSSSVVLNTSAEVQDDTGGEGEVQNTGSAISIGDAYTINVYTDNNQETTVSDNDLQKSPVSVRISYADEDLSAYGIDESTENEIKIYYWNSTQQKYQVLPDCKVNTDEKYVEGTLIDNGEYVLGVDKEGATISQFEVSDESMQPTITASFDGFSGIEGCLLDIDGTTVIDQTNFSEYYENGVIEYVVTEPLSSGDHSASIQIISSDGEPIGEPAVKTWSVDNEAPVLEDVAVENDPEDPENVQITAAVDGENIQAVYAKITGKEDADIFDMEYSEGEWVLLTDDIWTDTGAEVSIIVVTDAGNIIEKTGYAISPKVKISDADAFVKDAVWTGSAIKPEVIVKMANSTLIEGKDYTLKYSNNTNVGTGTVTIKGIGNYTGTKTVTFKIKAKTGWQQEDGYWYFYNTDGTKAVSTWMKDSKGWCWLQADGRMLTNGWAKDSKGYCWIASNGYMPEETKWIKVAGSWYHITKGYRDQSKWMKDSKGWCYLGSNGKMVTNGWAKDSKGWCWMGSNGYWVSNKWIKSGGQWYYIKSNHYMASNEWAKDSGGWMYMDGSGKITKNKWVKSGGYWYYLKSNGYMATGTVKISGKTYKFDSAGRWVS